MTSAHIHRARCCGKMRESEIARMKLRECSSETAGGGEYGTCCTDTDIWKANKMHEAANAEVARPKLMGDEQHARN